MPGQEVPVKRKMLKKIKHFLERDQDITLRDEWNYIYITLKETFKILIQRHEKTTNSSTNNL